MNLLCFDFAKYRDRFGMNQLSTDGTDGIVSQNGALFTFEYLLCLLENEETSGRISSALNRLRLVYRSLEVLPGLSRRTPESLEGDSMDNNTANLVFSALFGGSTFAKSMREQGIQIECTGPDPVQDPERNAKYYSLARFVTAINLLAHPAQWIPWVLDGCEPKFFWNNTRPTEFSIWGWYGRSPGFLGLVDLTATGWTTPFRWLSLLVGQFIGCFKDPSDTDARKLPYIVWYFLVKGTGPGQRWFWKLAYRLWVRILMKQYPNGMRDVYSQYYSDMNHPIRRYAKPYFKDGE